MKKLTLLLLASLSIMTLSWISPAVTSADTATSTICQTLGSDPSCNTEPANSTNVWDVIRRIVNIITIVVGVISVIMLIMGGFKMVTSAGDPAKAKSGRSTVIFALIGLVVVALAQVMVNLVLTQSSTL